MRKNDDPIVIEQVFDAPVQDAWKAITDIDQMRQWYFDNIPAFEARKGFETRFKVTSQGRDFLHVWKVINAEPMKIIAYTWRYEGYAGDSVVSFELFDHGQQTRLRLTHHILQSFPQDIPEFTHKSCMEGWAFLISFRLKNFLEKGQ